MPRELTSHKVNPANDVIRITAEDKPGPGGAHHDYILEVPTPQGRAVTLLRFQNGPINEVGVNGVTHEALLAVVEDRLKCFQDGPFKCRENALALTHLQEAMHWLHHRTRERMARQVEGTHTV